MTGGLSTTTGAGAQTYAGATTTGAGWAITTPGKGIPIPMFTRTPACEAVTAPSNTAQSNSVFFIQRVRRLPKQMGSGGRRIFAGFSLNKPGGAASVARSAGRVAGNASRPASLSTGQVSGGRESERR